MGDPRDILPPGTIDWEAVPEELLLRVAGFCAQGGLLDGIRRLLVGCSGGADSLALLALLSHPRFAPAAGLAAIPELVVGHVDHGLRPGSDEDAAFVARLAEGLELPCVAQTLRWPGGSVRGGGAAHEKGQAMPSEAEARQARLASLARLAEEVDAGGIALGHTASDQLETMIMRLLRGSGLQGLSGMAPRRGRFLRPLLPLTGVEARTLVAALGWTPREDPSNAQDTFLRNRIRHHVVPMLEAENPRAAQAAFRTSQVLREELESLDAVETATWDKVGSLAPGGPSVSAQALGALPVGLAGRLVRRMWRIVVSEGELLQRGSDPGELGREHVLRILGLLESDEGTSRVDLPGEVVALQTYGRLVFCARRRLDDPGDVDQPIPGPGLYSIDALGLSLEVLDISLEGIASPAVNDEAQADARSFGGAQGGSRQEEELLLYELGEPGTWSLRVRNFRPGDRVSIGVGHKKVSDLMVDCKVSLPARRRTPILASGDEILWIPGVFRARHCLDQPSRSRVGGEDATRPSTYRLVFRLGSASRSAG